MSTFSNQQQFPCSLFLSTIEITSKCAEIKVTPRAADKWFYCNFFKNIFTSFLCSMRVTTMENCCGHILDKYTRQFSFLTANSVEVSRKIAREKEKTNCTTITSCPSSVLLSTTGINLGFSKNAHLPLPYTNILS